MNKNKCEHDFEIDSAEQTDENEALVNYICAKCGYMFSEYTEIETKFGGETYRTNLKVGFQI